MTKKSVKTKIEIDKKLQKAIDRFPKVVKSKEKIAKEKKKIMDNFRSVGKLIYKD